MTRKGQDRAGEPTTGGSTGGAAAARDARLRAALRQNLARRKARAHALENSETPPQDLTGAKAPAVDGPPDCGPSGPKAGAASEPIDLSTDPSKDS